MSENASNWKFCDNQTWKDSNTTIPRVGFRLRIPMCPGENIKRSNHRSDSTSFIKYSGQPHKYNTPTPNQLETGQILKYDSSAMQAKEFVTLLLLFGGTMATTSIQEMTATQNISNPQVTPACVSFGYATFYDDHACSQNGGQAVALNNANCLANEFGRNSIYIQESCFNFQYHMVWSPGTNCDCQNDCDAVPVYQGCWDLGGHNGASSFRFIGSDCDPNNC